MNKDRRCGTCVNMRPTDGYCPRTGAWVNALAEPPKRCYVGRDELDEDIPQWHPPVREVKKERKERTVRTVWRRGSGTPEGTKYCPSCDRILPRENFCVCKTRYNGINWECKECAARRTREYKARKREEKEKGNG